MKKIIATSFCIAAFLGLLDAVVSLTDHLAEKTVSAGERDVQSVQEATEIFVNDKGIFESRERKRTKNPILNIQSKPVKLQDVNFTPVNNVNRKDDCCKKLACGCSSCCTCIKNGCKCYKTKNKCNPKCNCELNIKRVQCTCEGNCTCPVTGNCGCFTESKPVIIKVKPAIKPTTSNCSGLKMRNNYNRFFYNRCR